MQGMKATILAEFDPDNGNVSTVLSGSNLDMCFLIGHIVRDMAKSWAGVKNILEEPEMIKVLNTGQIRARWRRQARFIPRI